MKKFKIQFTTIIAIAILVSAFLFLSFYYRLSIISGYPIQIDAYQYRKSVVYQDGDWERTFETGNYLGTSSIQMPFFEGSCYATVEKYFWIFKVGETQARVTLGKDSSYGVSVTHGDVNLLTEDSAIWDYEEPYMGATGENPRVVNVNYWVRNETIDENTTRVYYETVQYKIYRFWSTVTFATYGEDVDVEVYGNLDADTMKHAIGMALQGINSQSHMSGYVDAMDNQQYPGVCLRLAIDPMAISSGEDWYGFLGAWVAGREPQKAGTQGGSSAQLEYEHPHDVIALYKYYGFPLNPYNPDNERAYSVFTNYPSMDDYTIEDLKNIPKDIMSDVVWMPIHILDFGVSYSTQDGDTSNPESFVTYAGQVSETLTYIFDVLTTSNSTWYQDYTKPESNPNANAGHIKGVVTDDRGRPLGGVQVETYDISGYSGVSDSEGNYFIENVPFGEHMLKASKIGYEDAYVSVVVSIGMTTERDITMTPSPNLFNQIIMFLAVVVVIAVITVLVFYYMKYKAISRVSTGITRSVGGMSGVGGPNWGLIIFSVALVVFIIVLYFIVQLIIPWWWG